MTLAEIRRRFIRRQARDKALVPLLLALATLAGAISLL